MTFREFTPTHTPNTPAERAAARRTIARHARDAEDERMLAEMLGVGDE